MKLTNKQKRGVRREVELDSQRTLNHSSVFVNKKKYKRKFKHKEIWKNSNNEQTKQKIIREYKEIK